MRPSIQVIHRRPITRRQKVTFAVVVAAFLAMLTFVNHVSPPAIGGTAPAAATYAYPAAAVAQYVGMCESDGNGKALCGCYADSLQRHFPYAQVKTLMVTNNGDAPEYTTLIADCAGR